MPRWAAGENPLYSAMAETPNLDDGIVGDTSTYVSATSPNGLTGVFVSGGIDLGSALSLDEIRFTGFASVAGGWHLWYSLDDVTYTSLEDDFPGFSGFQSFTRSYSEFSARFLRATIFDQDATEGPVEARLSDFRLYNNGSPIEPPDPEPCNPPLADYDLPRGTWRGFECTGNVGPDVDEWEIWRCDDLIDSGDLGGFGLNGWSVRRSSLGSGSDFDIFAPETAALLQGYQARIDNGASDCSIDFNVIDGDEIMSQCSNERAFVYERWQFGRENACGTPVLPNRYSVPMRMTVPNPMEPGTVVTEQGSSVPADIIGQKGHTETSIAGPMAYNDLIFVLASLGKVPEIRNVPGASQTKDLIFLLKAKQADAYDTWTVEAGQTEYPARFSMAAVLSGTFTFGKTENTFEGPVFGRRLDETLPAFAGTPGVNVTEINPVYVASPQNSHYIGTAVHTLIGTANLICEVETATLTIGQRRAPHFDQCPNQQSFSGYVPQAEDTLLSLQLGHKSASRGYLTSLRNRDLLYYGYKNTGPQIESGFNYELEIITPIKFEGRTTEESELVTAATYSARPLNRGDFNPASTATPGGYIQIRIRAPLSALPSAPTL